ncbi:MAG: hypothetical protein JWP44_2870 [Mucilaginibacter sp.]|nr:hypothetical protein [Mucilaginibacter sp.]
MLDLVIGILDIAFLGLLLLVINFYTTNKNLINSLPFQSLFNKNSLLLISLFLLLFTLKNWLGYRVSKFQQQFFYKVASRLSKYNLWYYLKDSYNKFITVDSSVYIRKISQQPIEFSNYILTNIQQVTSQSILILLTVTGLFFYHSQLLFSMFVLLIPPVIMLAYFIRKRLKNIRLNIKNTSQMTLQYLKETLSGFVESNLYDKNDFFITRYHRHQQQLNDNIATQQTLQGLPSRLIEVFAVFGFFILLVLNKVVLTTHSIGIVDISVFMAASYKIIPGIVKILNSAGQIRTYEFTLKDLCPIDESVFSVTSNNRPVTLYSVKFSKVCFAYKHHQILNNLSFQILPGDFVGISGRSGLGKTTITNLLLGFLEPDSGDIYINQTSTKSADRQTYWNRISYVKQQPFLINDSIVKNISLAEEGYDADKLSAALSFCGVERMLDKYPEGINKIITENGKNISGGQRQRLMLARALYHDFDLLILDEPFSEIDEKSERTLLSNLKSLAEKGKMIVMITHNKASLSFCNKTFSLDEE